jgi:hypothetical protein
VLNLHHVDLLCMVYSRAGMPSLVRAMCMGMLLCQAAAVPWAVLSRLSHRTAAAQVLFTRNCAYSAATFFQDQWEGCESRLYAQPALDPMLAPATCRPHALLSGARRSTCMPNAVV